MKRLFRDWRGWLLTGVLCLSMAVAGCQRGGERAETPQTPPQAPAAQQAVSTTPQAPVAPKPAASPGAEAAKAEGKAEAKAEADAKAVLAKAEGTRQAEARRTREQLSTPLVDQAEQLTRLDPKAPIWVDPKHTKVVLMGAVCQRQVPLELFACVEGTKEYESIVAVPVPAKLVHTALLTTGVDAGHPAQFGEKYTPPAGPVIDIALAWKNDKGIKQTARAQDWVREVGSKKAMSQPWVFVGSQLLKEEGTGQPYYMADSSGDLICVSNFPDSVLDLPIQSTDTDASLLFEAYTEHIPNRGTAVTLILTPGQEKPKAAEKKAEEKKP